MSGNRNLLLLGVGSIAITLIATGVELWVYRSSGDIYLDRSRPGFLPDREEVDEDNDDDDSGYSYPDTGPIESEEFDEYITELKAIESHIKKIPAPFSDTPLSDESLGII